MIPESTADDPSAAQANRIALAHDIQAALVAKGA